MNLCLLIIEKLQYWKRKNNLIYFFFISSPLFLIIPMKNIFYIHYKEDNVRNK